MKNVKKKFLVGLTVLMLLPCMGLLVAQGKANAISIASSQVIIDSVLFNTNGLSLLPDPRIISFPPSGPPTGVNTPSGAYSRFEVRDTNNFEHGSNPIHVPGLVFVDSAIAGAVTNAQGVASTTSAPTLFAQSNAFADANSPSKNFALAEAYQILQFIALESGTLTATANFRFDQDLNNDDPFGLTNAIGSAKLRFTNFRQNSSTIFDNDAKSFGNAMVGTGSQSLTQTGSLMVSLGFDPGDYGYFDLVVTARSSAVAAPEPTTMILLGCGLIGLIGFRRKFE